MILLDGRGMASYSSRQSFSMMAEEPCRRVDSKRRRLRKSTQLLSSERQTQTLFVIKITLLCSETFLTFPAPQPTLPIRAKYW